jgi:hypothetical protein
MTLGERRIGTALSIVGNNHMKLLKYYVTEQFKDVAFGEVFAWITFFALLALAVHYFF